MNFILLHAWSVKKSNGNYYLPYTHWVYLNEIVKYYDKVCLLSPTKIYNHAEQERLISLASFENVTVEELPPIKGYVSAIKYFFKYVKKYKNLKKYNTVYARYPVPFGWLQKVFLKKSNRIIHFVGDPVDAAKTNPNFSWFKKKLLILFFMPEHLLYLWACKGAKVYTNGFHLAERLKKQGVAATPLVSSTLNEEDFYFDENRILNKSTPKIVYLGNLRTAKGVETLIKAFSLLKEDYPQAIFSIIGSGEFEEELKKLVENLKLSNVNFLGRINDRKQINHLLRENDIFAFASLSEGSPRVILEAMANGLIVISTPVGSLPSIFSNYEELIFSDFNDEKMFKQKLIEVIENDNLGRKLKNQAFQKVQDFTIQKFLENVFKNN